MVAQGAVSHQAVAEAQQTIADLTQHCSGGNLLLDAEVEAARQMADSVEAQPAITDIVGNRQIDDPATPKVGTTKGAAPVDLVRLDEEDNLSFPEDNSGAE